MTMPDLAELDGAVEAALAHGSEADLQLLGYGEINSVVAWHDASGTYACKRLPIFADMARLDAYRACFSDYLDALTTSGIAVHDSRLEHLPRADGRVIAYCVQPALDPGQLAPAILRASDTASDRSAGRALLTGVLDHIGRTVRPTLGLDAQLSNWASSPRGLVYLDVTTPMLRDAHGRDRLDTDLFVASLPAPLRPVVRRFLVRGIVAPYFAVRPATLDVAGNLHKEGLASWIPDLVAIANERLEIDLTVDEVHRHYRRDARLWAAIQWSRRVDRAWQRHVRRRPYPFLLPGPVDRRL
ncbi:MAG: DUF6206 family protein [Acidimicrobiia bacterium]